MNGFDPLGYGTHLILDGFRADAIALRDDELVDAVLRAVGDLMHEGSGVSTARVRTGSGDAGVSAALLAPESQLCIHTFEDLDKLSLTVFSTRSVPTEQVTRTFVERFRVGRLESRVHGRARLLPTEEEGLQAALRGERDYARLRLRDLLGG